MYFSYLLPRKMHDHEELDMPKINKGYVSLYEYLVDKDFLFFNWLDSLLYPYEHQHAKTSPYGRRWNPNPGEYDQLLGALQPIADIWKDIIDINKPYKSKLFYVLREILQPLFGIAHLLRGTFNLTGATAVFFVNTIRYLWISQTKSYFFDIMKLNSHRTLSWFIDGLASLIRGTFQIVMTPATWFIKIPLRLYKTHQLGSPYIHENSGIQKLVSIGNYALLNGITYNKDCVRHELHRKFEKARVRGQASVIPSAIENSFFKSQHFKKTNIAWEPRLRADRKFAAALYLGLFSKNAKEREQSMQYHAVDSVGYFTLHKASKKYKSEQSAPRAKHF